MMSICNLAGMLKLSRNGELAGRTIFEVLRLQGRLLASGDALMERLGLTSARWQILGTIAFLGKPQTVANLARLMGLSRQSVQRVANELALEGQLKFVDNPAHKRAKLMALTPAGHYKAKAAEELRVPWTEALAGHCKGADFGAAAEALAALRKALDK